VLRALQAKARAEGLWAPQAPKEYGGMALPIVGWAAMYEEANRSIFGPLAFNCAAPDDGNMNLIALVGTPAQKEKWLRPIVEGKVRSSFAMTEPSPGGGSDPGMIRTRAQKQGNTWVIHGHKWFITAAGIADHFILVARTSDDARRAAGSPPSSITATSRAGASCAAFRSWGRRSTAATASFSSRASKCPRRTC
jgi:acyl-CoA dehydrogenase